MLHEKNLEKREKIQFAACDEKVFQVICIFRRRFRQCQKVLKV